MRMKDTRASDNFINRTIKAGLFYQVCIPRTIHFLSSLLAILT